MNNLNKAPYVSTYHIEGIVSPMEDVIINYYATNFNQEEYRHNKDVNLKLKYKIEGIEKVIDIKAGDNTLNLGRLVIGDKILELQVIDEDGLKSHILFIEFRVKEKEKLKIKDFKFNLSTPLENTTIINDAMVKAKEEGYNCLRLEHNKTIMTCENTPIKMISNFTLDLNKSTLKLNPSKLDGVSQVSFENCEESIITNGIVEGDYFEHDYNTEGAGEWVNGIHIGQGAKYCVVDVDVRNIAGYGINTSVGSGIDKGRKLGNFIDVDITEGKENKCNYRKSTVDYIDISHFSLPYLQIGFYLGYQGNATDNWVYNAHFYDKDKQFIETVEGYGYRRLFFSKDAHYVRFTLHTEKEVSKDISIFNFEQPLNCVIKNTKITNVRCVGMALGGFLQLLVDNCDFLDAGQKLGKCAVDLEDGWDLMQDLTFRRNRIHNIPTTGNSFLAAAGHNIILEDNDKLGAYMWGRCRSYVFRNNAFNLGGRYHYDGNIRTAFTRVCNNTYSKGINVKLDRNLEKFVAKNEKFYGSYPTGALTTDWFSDGYRIEFIDSEFTRNEEATGQTVRTLIKHSKFKDFHAYICDHSEFEKCSFEGRSIVRPNNNLTDSYFRDCNFENIRIQGNSSKLKFYNCTFNKFELELIGANDESDMYFENCTIVANDLKEMLLIKGSVNIKFVNCTITHNYNRELIHYISKDLKSKIEFIGCNIVKPKGFIVEGYYKGTYLTEDVDVKVMFKDCNISKLDYSYGGYKDEPKFKVILENCTEIEVVEEKAIYKDLEGNIVELLSISEDEYANAAKDELIEKDGKLYINKIVSECITNTFEYKGELNVNLKFPNDISDKTSGQEKDRVINIPGTVNCAWNGKNTIKGKLGITKYRNNNIRISIADGDAFSNEDITNILSNVKCKYVKKEAKLIEVVRG